MAWRVRPAAAEDDAVMAALHSASLPEGWGKEVFAAWRERPEYRLWVAEAEDSAPKDISVNPIPLREGGGCVGEKGMSSPLVVPPPQPSPARGEGVNRSTPEYYGEPACHTVSGLLVLRRLPPEAEIITLAVDAALRRRGIARALMEHAFSAPGEEVVVTACFLETAVTNRPALALYAALGFTLVGIRPCYYADGTDARVLRREARTLVPIRNQYTTYPRPLPVPPPEGGGDQA